MVSRVKEILETTFLEAENSEPIFVCLDCVTDSWLKGLASNLILERICACCEKPTLKAQTPAKIANTIREHLPNHFIVDYGLHPGYEMSLADVVGRAIRCSNLTICAAVAELLVDPNAGEEDFYFAEQEYCWSPGRFESEEHERWWVESDWNHIALELTHGRRFFNEKARVFFESLIFEAMRAGSYEHPDYPSVVKILPAASSFYRCRIARNTAEVREFEEDPFSKLGAPPKERAANNRMSAAGIPLLYVSSDAQTCIAEVRPSIGDSVVVGQFTSTVPLKFFDFTALSNLKHEPISLFSPDYEKRNDRRLLLEYLHDLIARPVRTTDTDYVMTQALAEYIRHNVQHSFDGIAFRSVQRSDGGINFVLFDKGLPDSMQVPNWAPQFDLVISADAVSTYQISGVTYQSTKGCE